MPSEVDLAAALSRVKESETSLVAQVLRTTVAAVTSYVAALFLAGTDPQPILAPLTALLVVQVTSYATFTTGVQRVASVVSGVLIAVLFSEAVGLNWWSLTLLLLASLGLGHLIRLGDSINEVAISAMIVLGVSQVADTAWDRVAETLIGAAVGMVFSLVLAPPVHVRPANEAVMSAFDALTRLLDTMAREIDDDVSHDRAHGWLEEARRIDRDIVRVDATLTTAEEGTRFNPRGRRATVRVLALRSGLDTAEISAVALRMVCRSLSGLYARGEHGEPAYTEIPLATAQSLRSLFHSLAALFAAYGHLLVLHGQDRPVDSAHAEVTLRERLAEAEEDRLRTEAILLADSIANPDRWELYGTLLTAVDKLVDETRPAGTPGDLAQRIEERRRRLAQERRLRAAVARPGPVLRESIRWVVTPTDRLLRVPRRLHRHTLRRRG
ncbi:aromatic acid exporter family protein (plasmid) [Embleya sp. NBC_00888]|uniref:FUSC family protein n=1 Tax=Embleya sp. NBC_00888 TaxID=2975960 RepID=UPI002F915823|nr:aromatic acid exporter family protein [Embleya sp. NBC_00888]